MLRGSTVDRAQILSRLTDLFLSTAPGMDEDQIGIFDVVIGRLARAIETAGAHRIVGAARARPERAERRRAPARARRDRRRAPGPDRLASA